MSPALAGGFLTTVPPGKFLNSFLFSFFFFLKLILFFFCFVFFKGFIYLFIYGCVGSSFLCEGFL